MPPDPTLAVRVTPAGSQKVAEKDAAAPPADVPGALPPPPPTSVAVTVQPPAGALMFIAGDDGIERPVPSGRRIHVGGGDAVAVEVGKLDGVALAVGDVDGIAVGVALTEAPNENVDEPVGELDGAVPRIIILSAKSAAAAEAPTATAVTRQQTDGLLSAATGIESERIPGNHVPVPVGASVCVTPKFVKGPAVLLVL